MSSLYVRDKELTPEEIRARTGGPHSFLGGLSMPHDAMLADAPSLTLSRDPSPMRDRRFVKAPPSIHRKEFAWHPGRDITLEDILRAHALSDGAPLGDAWFDALVRAQVAQARQTPAPRTVTPYEIGFGEATRIRHERFERAALARDNNARSEECHRRILASIGAPMMKEW